MSSDPRIDTFAKGWIAEKVRREPIVRLKSRLRASFLVILGLILLLVAAEVSGWAALSKYGLRLDVLLVLITLVMVLSAVQMWRFIKLRESIEGQA